MHFNRMINYGLFKIFKIDQNIFTHRFNENALQKTFVSLKTVTYEITCIRSEFFHKWKNITITDVTVSKCWFVTASRNTRYDDTFLNLYCYVHVHFVIKPMIWLLNLLILMIDIWWFLCAKMQKSYK